VLPLSNAIIAQTCTETSTTLSGAILIINMIAMLGSVSFFAYKSKDKLIKSLTSLTHGQHIKTIIQISKPQVLQYCFLVGATIFIPMLFMKQLNAEQRLMQGFADPACKSYVRNILIVIVFQLIHESAWRVRDIIKIYFSAGIQNTTFNYFLSNILDKEYAFFRSNASASIPFIAKQTSSACEKITNLSTKLIRHLSYILAILLKMYAISTFCGTTILVLTISWIVSSVCLWAVLSEASMEYSGLNNDLIEGCDDSVTNIDIIKSLQTENLEKQKISKLLGIRMDKEIYINVVMWVTWVIQGTLFALLFASIIYHLSRIYSALEMVGLCTICMRLLARLYEMIWRSSEDLEEYVKESGKLKYGLSVLNKFAHAKAIKPRLDMPLNTVAASCSNVQFQYNPDQQMFKFDAKFERNKITALVGLSGSGKSTLARMIVGIMHPEVGDINVYSKSIAYMPQNPILFRASIKYNLTYGSESANNNVDNNVDIQRMQSILDKVKFTMPENMTFDDKLNNNILSGGQLQKIVLARALYSNADILVLDEPTSALDYQSMADILEIISSLQDKTRIIISHSKSTIDLADNVVIIENGRTVYYGSLQTARDHDVYRKYLN
jgi:ABC-type multidrug transport system fused ATPase/permease subunit